MTIGIFFLLSALEAEEILTFSPDPNNADGKGKSLDELIEFPESEETTSADGNVLMDSDMSVTLDRLNAMMGSKNRPLSGAMVKDESKPVRE